MNGEHAVDAAPAVGLVLEYMTSPRRGCRNENHPRNDEDDAVVLVVAAAVVVRVVGILEHPTSHMNVHCLNVGDGMNQLSVLTISVHRKQEVLDK